MSYDRPVREGYRLKYDYECDYDNWLDLGGCNCPFSSPPCSSCTHKGHPISLEEDDEAWELDIDEEEEMSRNDIVKKDTSVRLFKKGDRVKRTKPSVSLTTNKIYTVTRDQMKRCSVYVEDDDGTEGGYDSWNFELFCEADPTTDFKVGDKVVLRESSEYYGGLNQLPKDGVGEVRDSNRAGSHPYLVDWGSRCNQYRAKDLQLFEECKKENLETKKFLRYPTQISIGLEYDPQTNKLFNKQEETNMSQIKRRVLNIQLLDNDAGLPVEYALVAEFDGVVTEDTDETTIQELISNGEVAKQIEAHNKVRIEQDNLEIQNRTGNTVKLRPIKLKNLTWNIK